MAEEAKEKGLNVKTGWVTVEFIKEHGSRKEGDTEKYHVSTANALTKKLKVAKVIKTHTTFVPSQEEK